MKRATNKRRGNITTGSHAHQSDMNQAETSPNSAFTILNTEY